MTVNAEKVFFSTSAASLADIDKRGKKLATRDAEKAGGFFGPYVLGVTRNSANTNFGRGLLAIGIILVVSSSLALLVRTDR